MPPSIALLLLFILLLWVFRYDPAKGDKVSPALWVPLIWMVLLGSRSVSQWLGPTTAVSVTTALEEGNALDHSIYLVLIVLALGILVARGLNWRAVFASNSALILFLLFTLLSVTWSDFPLASFRRWIRELGNYLMVLVVLSDSRPLETIETLLRRFSYLLIPISVVLIKYFREVGVGYSVWTGTAEFVGVATSKNMLGVLCLISGLFFFWDTLRRWPDRSAGKTKRILFLNIALIGMTLWVLNLADSATSKLCLLIGCLTITMVQSGPGKANPARLKLMIPTALGAGLVLEFVFNISDMVTGVVGRDSTLTGRTEIWTALLNANTNPLVGVGYESFWLGDRLRTIWTGLGVVGLNEAHNGYLETYLNLGLLGLCALGGFLIASYRTICRRLTVSLPFASLSLALWTILLIYNVTEAAFKSGTLWIAFLLVGIAVPRAVPEVRSSTRAAIANASLDERRS